MSKCFLSHSSLDKPCVEKIVNIIGKSKCVYDKYTFEAGMPTMDEILAGLDESDVFVYLISDSALNSDWVKEEFNEAIKRLRTDAAKINQIYPIIIDSTINHKDHRIPKILKDEYNLRVITSPNIIARKINAQLFKNNIYENPNFVKEKYFYGRTLDISKFTDRYYSPDRNELKSFVITGLSGIGKKAFIKKCLVEVNAIESYYNPICISLSKQSSIVDLILHLCDAGFGEYHFEQIVNASIDTCINILTEIINKIQEYKEVVIVEDEEESIVNHGDLQDWFYKSIKQSENGLSIIVTSISKINYSKQMKYPELFFYELKELNSSDSMGLFSTYCKNIGIDITISECRWFKNIFTGYPPQIIYCSNLIKENGIEFVKDNSYEVADFNTAVATKVINRCIKLNNRTYILSLLAVMSKFGIMSMNLLYKMCKINQQYLDVLNILKKYSICYEIGSCNEYIKINAIIQNYITRNNIEITKEIQEFLLNELNSFNKNLDESNVEQWDISDLKYFIKENIKSGIKSTDNFIYPTLFLQSITELYNNKKFNRIIELVEESSDSGTFEFYEKNIITQIKRLYCQSLIKNNSPKAEKEISYFKINGLNSDYYYLIGYLKRYIGQYDKAEKFLTKSLTYFPNNFAAMRELTLVYMTLQNFDSAIIVAKKNYLRNKENLFVIEAYFECLLESNNLSIKQKNDLNTMCETIKRINDVHESAIYYQLMAQYEAYYKKDIDKAREFINQGAYKFNNNMYINRTAFDIYRRNNDIDGMKNALKDLENSVNDLSYKGVYYSRKAIFDSYNGKDENQIREYLEMDCNVPVSSINAIIKKCHFI